MGPPYAWSMWVRQKQGTVSPCTSGSRSLLALFSHTSGCACGYLWNNHCSSQPTPKPLLRAGGSSCSSQGWGDALIILTCFVPMNLWDEVSGLGALGKVLSRICPCWRVSAGEVTPQGIGFLCFQVLFTYKHPHELKRWEMILWGFSCPQIIKINNFFRFPSYWTIWEKKQEQGIACSG